MASTSTLAPPAGGWRERTRSAFKDSPALAPMLVAVAIFVWFAGDEGGFKGTTFLLGGVFAIGLLLVSLASLPRPHPSRKVLAAVCLMGAYALWSYLSIAWADQKGVAWDGANRTVLYAVVFALFALWPIRGNAAGFVLGAFGLGVAAIGLVELLKVNGASLSVQYFHEGRLSEPTGYVNANVALWFTAFWPCVILACRREVHPLLRGLLLGAAGLLASLAVLGESRGWVLVLPLVAVLAIVVVPGRGRTIVSIAAVALGVLAILGPLLDVYDAFRPHGPPGPTFSSAVSAILLMSAVLVVLGAGAALLERRVRPSPRTARAISAAMVVVLALSAVGAVGVYAAAKGNPFTEVADKWNEFKKGGTEPHFGRSRFSIALTTYRYDYWRVAWREFTGKPLVGVGADNFRRDYLREGKSDQTPSYPHSTWLRALSQTGIVGGLLFYAALVAALAAAVPAVKRRFLGGAAAGAGVMVFAYWFIHGSLDWLWEFAGLGAPAMAFLGLAAAVAAFPLPLRPEPALLEGRGRLLLAGGAALVLGLGMLAPWLSERDLRHAKSEAARNPSGALSRLDRAADLNPLSPLPPQTAGVIEANSGRLEAARRDFGDALDREPDDPFSYLQLGAVASALGRQTDALALLERAHRLAPLDAPTTRALRRVQKGDRITPLAVNADIQKDIDVRIGPG
jgi:O-Antigen ligase